MSSFSGLGVTRRSLLRDWANFQESLDPDKDETPAKELKSATFQTVPCNCGAPMVRVTPAEAYGSGSHCDMCGSQNLRIKPCYHCPRKSSVIHPDGWDYCISCGVQFPSFSPSPLHTRPTHYQRTQNSNNSPAVMRTLKQP